eukprot:8424641-Pyramimonas_sp.AAC.1
MANTTGPWRPTFFGEKHASCIDYIMVQQDLIDSMISQGPLLRMGTSLQHIPSRYHRDHVPVQVTLRTPLRQ